ncbi:SH3 domain-containing protein [Hahella ganghwensis]|uniref:SH3 domain-containing protein n=1 Tax=Hahella ganghwensis TaxID=286420 RepID=UPI000371B418|nr:SH3 domain-containing protein [Hahella ganghwensis]
MKLLPGIAKFYPCAGGPTWLCGLILCTILIIPLMPAAAHAVDLKFWDNGDEKTLTLLVVDPYIEMHTAPGRGYPIFNVIEQGEEVVILKRKTNWYLVQSPDGQEGWVKAAQLGRTLKPTGIPADLPETGHGEYLTSSWRAGFTGGQFEGASSFSLTFGYRPLTWAGFEVEAGKIYSRSVTSEYYGANLIIEPLHKWKITPYLSVGASRFSFDARQKVLLEGVDEADAVSIGGGLGYYIGRNFLIRAEYRQYSISSNSDTTGLSEWKIGLNTFF